jgi:hypothetical protein
MFTADAQGVDELTRKWLRGNAMSEYFSRLGPGLSDISSRLADINETSWAEAGVVTCWVEQDYKYEGEPVHLAGPVTVVFHRENGAWRIAVVHAVPMPSSA